MTLPGPPLPAPLQTLRLWRDPAGFLGRCRREFGDAFALQLWPIGGVAVVASPELIAHLVLTPRDDLHTGEATRRVLPILGERSLPALDGAEHAERRRLLLPVFGGRRLAAHTASIEAALAAELARWPRGQPLRALPHLRPLTLAIAAELTLGERPAALERRLQDYVAGRAATGAWLPALIPARRVLEARRRRLDGFLLERVRSPAPGPHALAALLEAGLEEQAIVEELRTLLLVGHESTACALAWALERLARHPEVLERLRAGDGDYAEAVAREVLRSRPPVLDAVRLATRPLELDGGIRLAAGTIVMAAPLLLHHRPDLYPAPERFRPERFLIERPADGAYLPFGGGARRCLGAQLALLELKALLRVLADGYALAPTGPALERTRLIGTAVAPARGAEITLSPSRSRRQPGAAFSTAASSTATGGRSSLRWGRA